MVVPKTYTKYTSRKVLTTSWIDGEKLSQSTESDVGELVNVGVICYLKQVKYNNNRLGTLVILEAYFTYTFLTEETYLFFNVKCDHGVVFFFF